MGVTTLGAIFDSGLFAKGARGAVLKGLANFVNDDTHIAWPSYESLGFAAGVARETAFREIKWLSQAGVVEIVRRGGGARSNRYLMNVELIHACAGRVRAAKRAAGDDPIKRHRAAAAERDICEAMITEGMAGLIMPSDGVDLSSTPALLGVDLSSTPSACERDGDAGKSDPDAAKSDPDAGKMNDSSLEPLKEPLNNPYEHRQQNSESGEKGKSADSGAQQPTGSTAMLGDAPADVNSFATAEQVHHGEERILLEWLCDGSIARLTAPPFILPPDGLARDKATAFALSISGHSRKRVNSFISWAEKIEAGNANDTAPIRQVLAIVRARRDAIMGAVVKVRCKLLIGTLDADGHLPEVENVA